MTATQTSDTPACQVGVRIKAHRNGSATPGRVSSIHTTDNGVEYIKSTDSADSGPGHLLNICTTSGRAPFLTCASVVGGTR